MDDTPIDAHKINLAVTDVTTEIIQALASKVIVVHREQPCHRSRAHLNRALRQRLIAAMDLVLPTTELIDAA